jgi:hypothetical protein
MNYYSTQDTADGLNKVKIATSNTYKVPTKDYPLIQILSTFKKLRITSTDIGFCSIIYYLYRSKFNGKDSS